MKKNIYENKNEDVLVKEAVNDDIKMLEDIIAKVNDIIFNLSLRMLGTIADAVDAAHKIRDYIIIIQKNLIKFYSYGEKTEKCT